MKQRIRFLVGLLSLVFAAATAQALPTCATVLDGETYENRFGPVDYDKTPADCTINWVQDGHMMTIDWTFRSVFDQHEVYGESTFVDLPNGRQILVAPNPPHLIDIDQDGWLDIAMFSLIGMVNGDYDFFRYDPEIRRFVGFGSIWGSSFWRHEDGYLVAAGRSSAASSSVEAVRITDDGFIPQFGLYVDAGLQTGPDGAPECLVSVGGQELTNPTPAQIAKAFPEAPELIASYCDLYDGTKTFGTPLIDNRANPAIVPEGTVFYCQLQGSSKAVTVTLDDSGYHYAFGPVGGPPELTIDRPKDQVRVLPDNGAGPSRFGEITFQNGAYEYTVSYGYAHGDFTDAGFVSRREETYQRALIVIRDGDYANPVFDRTCDPNLSYDSIEFLRRS